MSDERVVRRYYGRNYIHGGKYTPEELEAARTVGYINDFNIKVSVYERLQELGRNLPPAFRLIPQGPTHSHYPDPPEEIVGKNPIRMGYIKPGSYGGDPHWVVWLVRDSS